MSIDLAKECIDNIIVEIYIAEEAASIYKNIAKESSTLNKSRYRNLFGIIQMQSLASVILSLVKLFEKPNKKYPNFSIPSALYYLHNDLANIPINHRFSYRFKYPNFYSTMYLSNKYFGLISL